MNKTDAVAELKTKLMEQHSALQESSVDWIIRESEYLARSQDGLPAAMERLGWDGDKPTLNTIEALLPDYQNSPFTLKIEAKKLFEALTLATFLQTASLVEALYSLQLVDNQHERCYTTIYDDPAPHSFYFVRMRIHIDEQGERTDVFAGNGGIIFHSYCKSWSIHT